MKVSTTSPPSQRPGHDGKLPTFFVRVCEMRKWVGWTNKEDSILDKHWFTATKEFIMELIPRHSWDAVKARACLRGLSRTKKRQQKTIREQQQYWFEKKRNVG